MTIVADLKEKITHHRQVPHGMYMNIKMIVSGPAGALAFEEMHTPYASGREICIPKFGDGYPTLSPSRNNYTSHRVINVKVTVFQTLKFKEFHLWVSPLLTLLYVLFSLISVFPAIITQFEGWRMVKSEACRDTETLV